MGGEPASVGGERTVDDLRHLSSVIGDLRQLCRIDRLQHDDGPARGTRLLRMVTGGGLEFEIHPDRCLDIGHVTWRGQSVSWASPAPVAAPGLVEHAGTGWLRTFSGGLLTTCGLDQFGSPSNDAGEEHGLHGRASSLPAQHVSTRIAPTSEGSVTLEAAGEMRQARLFGENLLLRRTVHSSLGAQSFVLTDTITNLGRELQPHMLLYHLNVGWPLLSPTCTIDVPSRAVKPRDAAAARGLSSWRTTPPPGDDWDEQVLLHELPPNEPITVEVTNPATKLALRVSFDSKELPHLFQWRHFRRGAYVLGLEPANCPGIEGRAAARSSDELPLLEPGESRSYRLTFAFGDA